MRALATYARRTSELSRLYANDMIGLDHAMYCSIGIAKELQNLDGLEKKSVRRQCTLSLKDKGDSLPLVGMSGKTWGAAVRVTATQAGKTTAGKTQGGGTFNPIYVSIGHDICLETAVELVAACCQHRVPEPVRLADLAGRDYIRTHF